MMKLEANTDKKVALQKPKQKAKPKNHKYGCKHRRYYVSYHYSTNEL